MPDSIEKVFLHPPNANVLALHLKFTDAAVGLLGVAQLTGEPVVVDLNHENIDLMRANLTQVLNAINYRITHAIPMPVVAFKNHCDFFHLISQVFLGEGVFLP